MEKSDKNGWCNTEAEIYLRHASKLKREGHSEEASKLLVRSNAAFYDQLKFLSKQPSNPYLQQIKDRRAVDLKRYGFRGD